MCYASWKRKWPRLRTRGPDSPRLGAFYGTAPHLRCPFLTADRGKREAGKSKAQLLPLHSEVGQYRQRLVELKIVDLPADQLDARACCIGHNARRDLSNQLDRIAIVVLRQGLQSMEQLRHRGRRRLRLIKQSHERKRSLQAARLGGPLRERSRDQFVG